MVCTLRPILLVFALVVLSVFPPGRNHIVSQSASSFMAGVFIIVVASCTLRPVVVKLAIRTLFSVPPGWSCFLLGKSNSLSMTIGLIVSMVASINLSGSCLLIIVSGVVTLMAESFVDV